jgi:hypothetical protein
MKRKGEKKKRWMPFPDRGNLNQPLVIFVSCMPFVQITNIHQFLGQKKLQFIHIFAFPSAIEGMLSWKKL